MHRVLHVINTAEVGGGGEHLLHLVQGLTPRGFASAVIMGRPGPTTARLQEVGIPVEIIGPMGAPALLRLARLFRAGRPDLVHLHGSRAGFLGSLAARMAGVRPVTYTAHALAFHRQASPLFQWAMARMEAATFRSVDRVICLTAADGKAAAARGMRTAHVVVIPNGIDVNRFDGIAGRRVELGVGDAPVAGMVARLVPQKNPLGFVRMARLVSEAVPDARFLLVGDGPLRPAVEHAIRELRLDGRVILTGFRPDIPEMMASMDVVVLPSLWEGLPIVALEAMAAGKPIVASDLPGLAEVVVDGETGVLVSPHDPARLANAVTVLLTDARQRLAMGQRARVRVAQAFSVERMVGATADLYRTMLASAQRP